MDQVVHLLRGTIGLSAILLAGFLLSRNRRAISWPLIAKAVAVQAVVSITLLKLPIASEVLNGLAELMVRVLNYSKEGAALVFGSVATDASLGGQIAFYVLPSIIFFSALTTLLYHWKLLPWLVRAGAWSMRKVMPISGPESLALAANVFLGPIEAALSVKPYLTKMTQSEFFCLMVAGMSTIAGGVMVAYIDILGGQSAELKVAFGRQLITASILSAPAAVVIAKLLIPTTETAPDELEASEAMKFENAFDALATGTNEGLRLALAVGAILIVFVALVAGLNDLLAHIGQWLGLNEWISSATDGLYDGLSIQLILGLLFAPVAWLIGVDSDQLLIAGQLLGEKTALNEFIAYNSLGQLMSTGEFNHPRDVAILTFALCGFSNFAGMGIMLGGLYALIPQRRAEVAKLGLWSLLAGSLTCLMTACWAGMLY